MLKYDYDNHFRCQQHLNYDNCSYFFYRCNTYLYIVTTYLLVYKYDYYRNITEISVHHLNISL